MVWYHLWDGVILVHPPNWIWVNEEVSNLSSNSITDIIAPDSAYAWVAHSNTGLSLVYTEEELIRTFRIDGGIPNNNIQEIAFGPDGSVWFSDPLIRFDGANWDDFSETESLVSDGFGTPTVSAMGFSEDGTLWLGRSLGRRAIKYKFEHLLVSWDGNAWETYGSEDEVMEGQAIDLDFGPEGSVWILMDHFFGGGNVGLVHYSADDWESFSSEDGFPSKAPTCLAVDREGAVWIGTEDAGLLKFFQGEWETFTQDDGLEGNEIHSLLIDDKG